VHTLTDTMPCRGLLQHMQSFRLEEEFWLVVCMAFETRVVRCLRPNAPANWRKSRWLKVSMIIVNVGRALSFNYTLETALQLREIRANLCQCTRRIEDTFSSLCLAAWLGETATDLGSPKFHTLFLPISLISKSHPPIRQAHPWQFVFGSEHTWW
jgi:hypothetical protein